MGKKPLVSILMPMLNSMPFLNERLETILAQTFYDWELIVVDSYSNDGSWELIKSYANNDPRIKTHQAPKDGIYPALNKCLEFAQGEYIYIAMSDDTMAPNCLEKMITVLYEYDDCDVCHCCLQIIDQNGNHHKNTSWKNFLAQKYLGDLIDKKHIRIAPINGILYSGLGTVYSSMTQLLIRKKIFNEIGLFRDDWGSYSDFEWGMRISFIYNTIHIPYYLATFRKHSNQSTPQEIDKIDNLNKKIEMIKEAYKVFQNISPEYKNSINLSDLCRFYTDDITKEMILCQKNFQKKLFICIRVFFTKPILLVELFWDRLIKKIMLDNSILLTRHIKIDRMIKKFKLENNIIIL